MWGWSIIIAPAAPQTTKNHYIFNHFGAPFRRPICILSRRTIFATRLARAWISRWTKVGPFLDHKWSSLGPNTGPLCVPIMNHFEAKNGSL